MRYFILFGLALLPVLVAEAQPGHARFTIAWHVGRTTGGPIGDMETHLSESGFAQTLPAGCFFIFCREDDTQHPRTEIERLNLGLSAEYTVSRSIATGIVLSHQRFGETTGYNGSQFKTLAGSLLSLESILLLGGPSLYTRKNISLGLGPGLYRSSISPGRYRYGTSASSTGIGLVVSLMVRVPVGPLFVQARYLRRFVGDRSLGTTLPGSDSSFSHSVLEVGAGFKFGSTGR
jgi:hypothetical protein